VSPLAGSRALKLGLAGVAAAVLCVVLASRVFVAFEGQRAKLVKASIDAVQGQVLVDTSFDPRVAALDAPVAVIASIRNTGRSPESVSLRADGRVICDAVIPAASSRRVDCVASEGWTRRADHAIELRGRSNAWALDYLELATHHGSSTGGVYLVVLPEVATGWGRAGPVVIALAWMAIVAVWLVPVTRYWSPTALVVHRGLSAVAILFLAALVVSPWCSPFLVLISAAAFAKVVAVLLAPQLWELLLQGQARVMQALARTRSWRPGITAGAMAAVVLLAYGSVVRSTARELEGRYSGLLRVSMQAFDRVPFLQDREDIRSSLLLLPDAGYDAQFQYFAMFDPLMRQYAAEPQLYRRVADAPPYRYGRIGFPLMARVLAGARWQQYPATMVLLVWAGVGLTALALALIALRVGANPAWGLLALAIPGFWQSVRVTLPEPIAAALLLLGYLCVLSRRTRLATVLFAASLLVRETGVVLVLAIACLAARGELSMRSRALLVSSALPVVLWRVYVAAVLWPDWRWEGLIYSPHVMTLPFVGLAGLWSDLWHGRHHPDVPALIRGAFWFSLLLVGVAAAAWPVARSTGRVLGAALVAYAVMALSFSNPTVWAHVANGQRASYEVFLLLALATISFQEYSPRVKAGLAACWVGTAAYLLFGAHDALSTREALMPWI